MWKTHVLCCHLLVKFAHSYCDREEGATFIMMFVLFYLKEFILITCSKLNKSLKLRCHYPFKLNHQWDRLVNKDKRWSRGKRVSQQKSSSYSFSIFFCPYLPSSCLVPLLTFPANELTVGKVYAALMIFDYYKQNRARRLQLQQQQQQNASGTQV